MSLKDRNRYKNEMKNYVPILNRKIDIKGTKKKSDKQPSKRRSKRNESEIMYDNYIKSKKTRTKKTHPDLDSQGVIDYLKSKWEKLTDEKKNKYKKK